MQSCPGITGQLFLFVLAKRGFREVMSLKRRRRVNLKISLADFDYFIRELSSRGGGGVTPIGGLVKMCLPGLWVNLRYFALAIGHVM